MWVDYAREFVRGSVWRRMAWCDMVWYGMVWYGMVWYGMVHVLGGADPSVGLSVDEATLSSPSSTPASPGGVGVPPFDDMPVDVC